MTKKLYLFPFLLLFLPLAAGIVRADAIGAGFFDDRYILISYSGCSTGTDANYYAGTYMACGTIGNSVSFEFYGSEFAVWSSRRSTGGNKEVCIDGDCTVISNYNATTVYGEWFRVSDLAIDFHTVVITNQAGVWQFDALFVAPSDAVGTPPPSIHIIEVDLIVPVEVEVTVEAPIVNVEVTVEAGGGAGAETTPEADLVEWEISNSEESQAVSFEYTATAGDVAIAIGLYSLIVLTAVSLMVKLWQK